MAEKYSNLYKVAPNAEGTSADPIYIYEGPSGPMSRGQGYFVVGQYDNPANGFGADDVLNLCKVPEGTKLIRFAAVPSADLDGSNSFTFDLGWDSDPDAFLNDSAGLQGTTAVTVAADAVIAAVNSADGDTLQLTRVAGAWANAGILRFVAEFAHDRKPA